MKEWDFLVSLKEGWGRQVKWGQHLCSSFTDGEIGLHKGHEGNARTANRTLWSSFVFVLGYTWCFWKGRKCTLVWKEVIRGFMEEVSRKKQCLWPTDVSWHEIQGVVGSGVRAVMYFKQCVFLILPVRNFWTVLPDDTQKRLWTRGYD